MLARHPSSGPDRPDAGADALAGHLHGIAAGDRAAFEELYRLTSAKLFSACLRILPDRREAEEALQETYLTVWRNAASFDRARGRSMTWLLTLARNRAVDRLRAGHGKEIGGASLDIDVADDAPSPFAQLHADEEAKRLSACLDQLPGADLRFIQASFFEGSTYAELAQRAAMPLGSVKSRIRRALLKLRQCLA